MTSASPDFTKDFADVRTRFDGWSFATGFSSKRGVELVRWRSFAAIAEAVLTGEVHCVTWESFSNDRLRGCWRVAFELRFQDASICDAFYNAPTGYRAQFARSIEDGAGADRWLIDRLVPQLQQTCRERGIDVGPVMSSLMGKQAKLWIAEPGDKSHLIGKPAICCHQWSGPGQCAPIAERLEVKGAWLDPKGEPTLDRSKENRDQQIHETGFT